MADDNAAMIAALKGLSPQDQAAMRPETFANPAVQSILGSMATLPQRAIENSQYSLDTGTYDPIVPMEAATSLAGVGAPIAEAGAAGIFGGKLAKTADIDKLIYANKMQELGKSPNNIWGETGWFKSPTDNKWKFEIPDNSARMSSHNLLDYSEEGNMLRGPVEALIDHPELYKAYPQIKGIDTYSSVHLDPRNGVGTGQWDNGTWGEGAAPHPMLEFAAPDVAKSKSVGMHELQHVVQDLEHFAPGGNPSAMAAIQEKTPSKMPLFERNTPPFKIYERLGGEVEARNVQNRLDFDPIHRRMITPWSTQDTPFRDQLVYDPRYDLVSALRHLK